MLKDEVRLDITKLDQHALDQPALYEEWGSKWAEACFERDKCKERLAAAKAEADDEIRRTPANFGWDQTKSPTEAWVASQIIGHKKVKEATDELLTAQYNVNMMTIAKEALDHRRKSLEILTDLYKNSYFVARSRTNENYVSQKTDEVRQEQQAELKKEMPRRRRT